MTRATLTAAAALAAAAMTAGAATAETPSPAAASGASPAAPARSAAAATRCLAATVTVPAGGSVVLRLDCSVRRGGRRAVLIRGARVGARRSLAVRPKSGRLASFDARRGTVRYRPKAGFSGREVLEFRVRLASGRRLAGRIVILVAAAKPAPAAPLVVPAPAAPAAGGLPPAPPSVAFAQRNWQPTAQDTCPRSLHERYSVIGPGGKLYPTWHPAVVTDPATGKECTFGHEHGRDPRGSDIYDWVAAHFAAPGEEAYAGIPFGAATEALEDYPGAAKRSEDHVGYKIDYANDVPLTTAAGAHGVTCDYLVRVHQGSHSADALSNNVHELLYASRCTDGTEIISNIVGRFGAPGAYTRGCDPATTVATTPSAYPAGDGARLIPDRACMESDFLVPAGRTTSVWAAYELWRARSALTTADGRTLASYATGFGVFNPSRYASGTGIRRTIDLCGEVEPSGDRAAGGGCTGCSRSTMSSRRSTARTATRTCRARRSPTRPARGCGGRTRTEGTRPPRRSRAGSASSSARSTRPIAATCNRRCSGATATTEARAYTRRTSEMRPRLMAGPPSADGKSTGCDLQLC